MIDEKRVREAEKWFREHDTISFDPEEEGIQKIRDIWQAIRDGYVLVRGDRNEGTS